jgi:hypothetical protein
MVRRTNYCGTHGYGYGGIDGLGYDDLGVHTANGRIYGSWVDDYWDSAKRAISTAGKVASSITTSPVAKVAGEVASSTAPVYSIVKEAARTPAKVYKLVNSSPKVETEVPTYPDYGPQTPAPVDPEPEGLPDWVVPVAVGGGLILIALLSFGGNRRRRPQRSYGYDGGY